MFRIGEFSRLSQVSVKALRFYDEVGLLTWLRDCGAALRVVLAGQRCAGRRFRRDRDSVSDSQTADSLFGWPLSPQQLIFKGNQI